MGWKQGSITLSLGSDLGAVGCAVSLNPTHISSVCIDLGARSRPVVSRKETVTTCQQEPLAAA